MGSITHTVQGTLASFISPAPANIESLKIYFKPHQVGIGDANPNNIKPIYGFNGLKYYTTNNLIHHIPINFTPINLNGGTLDYLGDNTFYLTGTLTSNTTFTIPIQPFLLKKGYSYKRGIIIETYGARVTNTSSIGISYSQNTTAVYSTILSSNSSYIDTWNIDTIQVNADYEISVLKFNLRAGWSDIKIRLYLSDKNINVNTISWNTDIEDIYGGYIDLVNGTLVETHKYQILNDVESWINHPNISRAFAYDNHIFNVDYSKGTSYGIICTAAPPASENTNNIYCRWFLDSNTYIYFVMRYSSNMENPPTLEDIKQLAAENKIAIIYELKTPITHQLNSIQLQTLIGRNNIWSNANDKVSVTYDIHETSQISNIKKKIIRNSPHLALSSGNIATFNTDMIAPIKSAKFYFNPIQEGSGDPSSENVRNISGWTGLKYANLTDTSIASVRDFNFTIAHVDYTFDNTSNPQNVKIIGTSDEGSSNPIILTEDNATSGETYYIYGLPTLDHIVWLCGVGTNLNSTKLDPNVLKINGANGVPIVASSSNKLRVYFMQRQYTTYNLDFYPMISKIAPTEINWSSTAGIAYGGYIDLITGQLVKTYGYQNLGYSGISWLRSKDHTFITHDLYVSAMYTGKDTLPYCLCDKFTVKTYNDFKNNYLSQTSNDYWLTCYNDMIIIANPNFATMTDSEVKNFMNNKYLCMKLPSERYTSYQLTSQTIQTLRGTNNIWSTANGQTEIQYWTH